jgi:DNA-binding MarR family transcriptional regulator
VTKYTPDPKHGRLLPLQGKVSRLVQSLARSSFQKVPLEPEESTSETIAPEVPQEVVARMVRTWRERAYYLPGELLSDPAWGMLLELLYGELANRRVSLSRLSRISCVSTASTVRWLKALESRELVVRNVDPHGPQNEFVELTPRASLALRRYIRDVVQDR